MRTLEAEEIGRYLDAELPFDCAGSFKSEGLGMALFFASVDTAPRQRLTAPPLP